MPKIEDLDQLKEIVNSMGNEPAIREERGESIEEITPPEAGLSPDLSDLLGLALEEQKSDAASVESAIGTSTSLTGNQTDPDSFSLDNFAAEPQAGEPGAVPEFDSLVNDPGAGMGGEADLPLDSFDLENIVPDAEESFPVGTDSSDAGSITLDSTELDAILGDTVAMETPGDVRAANLQDDTIPTDNTPVLDTSGLEDLMGGVELPEQDTVPSETFEADSFEQTGVDNTPMFENTDLDALLGDSVEPESGEPEISDESVSGDMPVDDSFGEDSVFGQTGAANEPTMQMPDLGGGDSDNEFLGAGFDESDTSSLDTLGDFDLPDISEMTTLDTEQTTQSPEFSGEISMDETPSLEDTLAALAGESPRPETETGGFDDFELPENMDFSISENDTGTDSDTPVFEAPEPSGGMDEDTSGGSIDLDSFELPDFGDIQGSSEEESGSLFTGLAEPPDDFSAEPGGFEASNMDGFEMPDISGLEGGPVEDTTSQNVPSFMETDDFSVPESGMGDEVSFEMPDVGESFDTGEESTGIAGDEQLDHFSIDEFALPDIGGDFEVGEPEASFEQEPDAPLKGRETAGKPVVDQHLESEDSFKFSDGQFNKIKETLLSLPLNLKIMVEELVGEQELGGENLKNLLDALVRGESPKEIARIVSAITGKRIVLPKSFEKRTGMDFEHERDSFSYFLRKTGWKIALGVGAAVGLLFLVVLGIMEISKPITAAGIYDEGYALLLENKFLEANRKFMEASEIWDSRDQYYRFAEGFIRKDQLLYAQKKYHDLLMKYPGDEKGTIDYARLDTLRGSNSGNPDFFIHAEQLLVTGKYDDKTNLLIFEGLLMNDMNNLDANIAAADNYLAWAAIDFSKRTDAAQTYDFIAEQFRDRPEAYLKRVDYLIKIEKTAHEQGITDFDNLNHVLAYRQYFHDKNYSVADPGVYTRLAEYLIDKKEYDDVVDILDKARELDNTNPLTFYEYARLFRATGIRDEELKFLNNAAMAFEQQVNDEEHKDAFTVARERKYDLERTAKQIITYNRLGEFYLYSPSDPRPEIALQKLTLAQKLFEVSPTRLMGTEFGRSGEFGKIYFNLGNINYSAGNYSGALGFFERAEEYRYFDPDQKYKIGYIKYVRNDLDDALQDFHRVLQDLPENKAALFALATTEYERNQFAIAHGYYLHLLKILEQEKNEIPGSPQVNENPSHRNLIFNIFVVENNLGCTYFKQVPNKGESYITKALVMLGKAAVLFDIVSRDIQTLKRLEETTIARVHGRLETVKKNGPEDDARYLVAPRYARNQDVITHGKNTDPRDPVDVEIYPSLPYTIYTTQLLPSEFYPLKMDQ